MVSTGKAGNVETALQGHGNICGSGTSNGIPCCIQAGTALHVDNYFDYWWVHRTPLNVSFVVSFLYSFPYIVESKFGDYATPNALVEQ